MTNGEVQKNRVATLITSHTEGDKAFHSTWLASATAQLQHGDIEALKIQHDLHVIPEVVRKKLKFAA